MPKIILEKEKCIGCGTCAAICDAIFELASDSKANIKGSTMAGGNEELEIADVGCANEAVNSCPVQCIKINN